jgi:hypothetical protein
VIPLLVTTRSGDLELPARKAEGFAPAATSPLAVTKVCHWSYDDERWVDHDGQWCITHIPTGHTLGPDDWPTAQEAYEVLLRCDPDYPAWPLAIGDDDDAATKACKIKFRGANIAASPEEKTNDQAFRTPWSFLSLVRGV